jgi:hypothetical protein
MDWDPQMVRSEALKFSYERFREEYRAFVHEKMIAFNGMKTCK